MVKATTEARDFKDSVRYAKGHQEQQGYFEEGMQLIYHYGGVGMINASTSRDLRLNDTKRTKRGHSEETAEVRIGVSLVEMRESVEIDEKPRQFESFPARN